jgi:histidinol dehydrogenase
MRIVKLTKNVERLLLRARRERDLKAKRVAARIITDVRRRGDAAVVQWTKKLDGLDLRTGTWVSARDIHKAVNNISEDFRTAIEHAVRNIRAVAEKQLPRGWTLEVEQGVRITQVIRPIESIGCYIPGGRFSLMSTLLMTIIPALVAGVKRIVIASPKPNVELLAAADILGVSRIAKIGGAQAIAALAYGTKSIAPVDKIFGPGNCFVTAAKQLISGDCAIDLPAGPTEAVVLASTGNARWIAADLLAQAEHGPDAASFLVTTSRDLAVLTQLEVRKQLKMLPESNPAHLSTLRAGAILLAPSLDAACEFINRFAPEHLSVPQNSNALINKVRAAGTVFLGPWSAQPLGDYASGSNHVLPTAGWARARGGLTTADFVKCISMQSISRKGFQRLAKDVQVLARAEGLLAHANSVGARA